MGRSGVLGIIVPIYDDGVMHDIFHGKSVHASLAKTESTDLDKGDRIFFHDSLKTHRLMGEAVIAEIAFEEAGGVLAKLGGELYMGRGAFEAYVSALPEGSMSKMRVLHFRDPILYANPVRCDLPIAEAGTYMTAEVFSAIAKSN